MAERRRLSPSCSLWLSSLCLCVSVVQSSSAHPVPKEAYDRTVVVRPDAAGVSVTYKLQLDEYTALVDVSRLPPDVVDLSRLKTPREVHEAFTDSRKSALAEGLHATLDGRRLSFRCDRGSWEVTDHLACTFVFRADWPAPPTGKHAFRLRDDNYADKKGAIDLSLEADPSLALGGRVEPDKALKEKPPIDWRPGDEQRLRTVAATAEPTAVAAALPAEEPATTAAPKSLTAQMRERGLLALLDSPHGFGMLLVLAGLFGAAHALTPGHGKTLVAAYLVGERGTVGHALFLGLVTTATHTGAVLLVAALLPLLVPNAAPEKVQAVLGFGGGLLVAGMGVWLLLRRLSGGADHVHIGGGHHHHHGPGHHHHHHVPELPKDGVRWWNLVVLGVSGGIVPCWDAIALLGLAVATRQLWLGLPLLLAFSAGLAGVLVAVGVAVVKLKGFGASRWGDGRVIRALPLVSAVAITVMGLWICRDSLGH